MKCYYIAVFLILLLSFGLSGCSSGGESTDTQTASTTQSATQIDPASQQTEKPATDPQRAQEIQDLSYKLRSSDERVAYDAV